MSGVFFLNKAGVKRELLDTVKARKLAYYVHTTTKQGSCLEKEMMQGKMLGARRRGRPRTARMDNIKTLTGLAVKESIRMTEDMDKYRKYVHVRGVVNPRIVDGRVTEQNLPFQLSQNLPRRPSRTKIAAFGRTTAVVDHSEISFWIVRGTLPWQPIFDCFIHTS